MWIFFSSSSPQRERERERERVMISFVIEYIIFVGIKNAIKMI